MSALADAREILDRLRMGAVQLQTSVTITKADDELRVVWGWASIIEEGGRPVIDSQGDVIYEQELVKAAHEFVCMSRTGGLMHAKRADGSPIQTGTVVESIVFTKALQQAMGIDLGRVGWFIGMHVPEPDAWALVRKGVLPAFSIGGTGTRTPVELFP